MNQYMKRKKKIGIGIIAAVRRTIANQRGISLGFVIYMERIRITRDQKGSF